MYSYETGAECHLASVRILSTAEAGAQRPVGSA